MQRKRRGLVKSLLILDHESKDLCRTSITRSQRPVKMQAKNRWRGSRKRMAFNIRLVLTTRSREASLVLNSVHQHHADFTLAANCRSKSIDTSPQPSPRSQRASLREKKAFNVPPDSSFLNNGPKAAPRFKQFAQSAPSTYLARPTRSSAPSRHAFSSTDPNVAKLNSHLREAAHTAADKLGLTDQESPLDTSAITNSSVFSAISGAKVACDNLELDNDKLDSGRTLTESDTLPSSTVPASSLPSHSSENLTVSSGLSSPPRSPSTARCPLCNSSVDKEFFYEETGGRRLKLREQAAFCKAHNVRSANIQWRDRGYPDINWQDFDGRITGYHSVLDDILQGRRVSYYRNAFEDSMKKGMNRTLRQTLLQGQSTEALSPGYYGSKGARIMYEVLSKCFLLPPLIFINRVSGLII